MTSRLLSAAVSSPTTLVSSKSGRSKLVASRPLSATVSSLDKLVSSKSGRSKLVVAKPSSAIVSSFPSRASRWESSSSSCSLSEAAIAAAPRPRAAAPTPAASSAFEPSASCSSATRASSSMTESTEAKSSRSRLSKSNAGTTSDELSVKSRLTSPKSGKSSMVAGVSEMATVSSGESASKAEKETSENSSSWSGADGKESTEVKSSRSKSGNSKSAIPAPPPAAGWGKSSWANCSSGSSTDPFTGASGSDGCSKSPSETSGTAVSSTILSFFSAGRFTRSDFVALVLPDSGSTTSASSILFSSSLRVKVMFVSPPGWGVNSDNSSVSTYSASSMVPDSERYRSMEAVV